MRVNDASAKADGNLVDLVTGENIIAVMVMHGTGNAMVTTPYTVVITRRASDDATLSFRHVSGVDLSPMFIPSDDGSWS